MKDDVRAKHRRVDAGARIPVTVKLKLPSLDAGARQRLADSLGLDRKAFDSLTLPRTITEQFLSLWKRPKRFGLATLFELLIHGAITDLAAKAAGPRARAIAAELTKFANKDLAPFAAAYHRLSGTARAHICGFLPEFEWALDLLSRGVPIVAAELPKEPPAYLGLLDNFLHDIITVARAADVHPSLPPKLNYASADQYPSFLVARAAVEIAHEMAKHHAPAAAPDLQRLRGNADATFVDRLYQAMRPLPDLD